MATIRTLQAEATAICKGIEMTHGNSAHFLTFELDSGERIYFQVSMKCYMLVVEGDRCLITYKSLTNSPKKKLKSFERIGKTVMGQKSPQEQGQSPASQQQLTGGQSGQLGYTQHIDQTQQFGLVEESMDETKQITPVTDDTMDTRPRSFRE